ncbi:MAG TPA: hypothetical protein VN759_13065 [Pseudolysinimonas sp.]|nr:hypothetical protein [Pseudolysinimonas sp.]
MSSIKDDTVKNVNKLKDEAGKRAQIVQRVGITNPVRALSEAGFRSEWAYLGGFVSIGVSLASWLISRAKPSDDKAQSDRWGIFVGHWAPTFFALGIALKHEELDQQYDR